MLQKLMHQICIEDDIFSCATQCVLVFSCRGALLKLGWQTYKKGFYELWKLLNIRVFLPSFMSKFKGLILQRLAASSPGNVHFWFCVCVEKDVEKHTFHLVCSSTYSVFGGRVEMSGCLLEWRQGWLVDQLSFIHPRLSCGKMLKLPEMKRS